MDLSFQTKIFIFGLSLSLHRVVGENVEEFILGYWIFPPPPLKYIFIYKHIKNSDFVTVDRVSVFILGFSGILASGWVVLFGSVVERAAR